MASRNFNRVQSLEKEIKVLQLKVTTGALGVVSSIRGQGIASVTHNSDVYTIVLEDRYSELLAVAVTPGVQATHILSDDSVNSTSKSLEITFSATQASTVFTVALHLKNSSV